MLAAFVLERLFKEEADDDRDLVCVAGARTPLKEGVSFWLDDLSFTAEESALILSMLDPRSEETLSFSLADADEGDDKSFCPPSDLLPDFRFLVLSTSPSRLAGEGVIVVSVKLAVVNLEEIATLSPPLPDPDLPLSLSLPSLSLPSPSDEAEFLVVKADELVIVYDRTESAGDLGLSSLEC